MAMKPRSLAAGRGLLQRARPFQHRLMVQGMLFSPWGAGPRRATGGHQVAQGRWLRPSQMPDLARSYPHATWVQRQRPLWFGPWHGDPMARIGTSDLAEVVGTSPLEYAQLWSALPLPEKPEEMFIVVPEDWGT